MHPDRRNDQVVRNTAELIVQLLEPIGLGMSLKG